MRQVQLALELTDACIKNCTPRVHAAVGTKDFLNEIEALTVEGKHKWEVIDAPFEVTSWAIAGSKLGAF